MKTIDKNIINLFIQDTHLCSVHGLQLMKYQIEKHGWTSEQWNEYYEIYKQSLHRVVILSDEEKISYLDKNIKITNEQLGKVLTSLKDILTNLEANIDILNDEELSEYFLVPMLKYVSKVSDKLFIQTRTTVNEINLSK